MIVVGLDSAAHTGYAVVEATGVRERLVKHGTFVIRRAADVEGAVAELAALRPDLIAIEEVFVRLNPQTSITLAVLLGRWLQSWERLGIPTTTVLGSTWQIAMLAGLIDRTSGRAARKKAARVWASGTFDGVELSFDEADAAGIACWAARRALFEARKRAAG